VRQYLNAGFHDHRRTVDESRMTRWGVKHQL